MTLPLLILAGAALAAAGSAQADAPDLPAAPEFHYGRTMSAGDCRPQLNLTVVTVPLPWFVCG